jgi:hypothetical protein
VEGNSRGEEMKFVGVETIIEILSYGDPVFSSRSSLALSDTARCA